MTKRLKLWLFAAFSLTLGGLIIFGSVMTMLKWDFKKLSTVKYETASYEISEDFDSISLLTSTADIAFLPSPDGKVRVECYEESKGKHSVSVKDGTLVIELQSTKKWYDYIGINFDSPSITVYLPAKEYESLTVKCSTGDIQVSGVSAGQISLSVSTGKVTASDISCGGVLSVKVSTGNAELSDIRCKILTSDGNTGDLHLQRVVATEKFVLERSTGDISLDACDAAEIYVTTDTGDVKGTLLSDKVFIVNTDTGKTDVPASTTGGRCEITTDTGDIIIRID